MRGYEAVQSGLYNGTLKGVSYPPNHVQGTMSDPQWGLPVRGEFDTNGRPIPGQEYYIGNQKFTCGNDGRIPIEWWDYDAYMMGQRSYHGSSSSEGSLGLVGSAVAVAAALVVAPIELIKIFHKAKKTVDEQRREQIKDGTVERLCRLFSRCSARSCCVAQPTISNATSPIIIPLITNSCFGNIMRSKNFTKSSQ